MVNVLKPLNAKLNPICHLLVLLGAHHILHVSRVRVNTSFGDIVGETLKEKILSELPFERNFQQRNRQLELKKHKDF